MKTNELNELSKMTYEAADVTSKCSRYMRKRLEKSIEIFKTKNPAYGNSAIRGMERYGVESGIWRLFDKFNRLESLICCGIENNVSDETIEDTLIDLANYSMIMAYFIHRSNVIKGCDYSRQSGACCFPECPHACGYDPDIDDTIAKVLYEDNGHAECGEMLKECECECEPNQDEWEPL